MRALFLSLLLVAGCGDTSTTSTPPDLAVRTIDLAFKSDCGHPGDVGNALGVGKFCTTISDCAGNTKATLCTTLGDQTNFFCTFACQANGAADQCGTGATCRCSGGGCGCHPNACDTPGLGG